VSRGLLGTSVLIAQEGQRLDISALPDEVAVSVVTYGELRAGVLAATDVSVRSRRLSTLQTVAELGPAPSTRPWPTSAPGSGSSWPRPDGG
jgi:predicted nucleic acid-binding protein